MSEWVDFDNIEDLMDILLETFSDYEFSKIEKPKAKSIEVVKEKVKKTEEKVLRKGSGGVVYKELPKGIVLKGQNRSVNTMNMNELRLIDSTLDEMLSEILKNAFEHGLNLSITFNDNDETIIFRNRIKPEDYDELDFQLLMEKLTTYQEMSSKNFNEGLTTILFCLFKLRVKDLQLVSEYTTDIPEDSFFQNYSTELSSHFYQRDSKVIYKTPKNFPENKSWELTIYAGETEKILNENLKKEIEILQPTLDELLKDKEEGIAKESVEKGIENLTKIIDFKKKHLTDTKNLYDKLKEMLLGDDTIEDPFQDNFGVLHSFLIPSEFNVSITINEDKEKFKSKFPSWIKNKLSKTTDIHFTYYKDRGWGKFFIDMPSIEQSDDFYILWQLRDLEFYQIIDNKNLFGKDAIGFVIATINDQFESKKRLNLQKGVNGMIETEIRAFVSSHKNEKKLRDLINDYDDFKQSMTNFLKVVLNIPIGYTKQVFFEEQRSIDQKITNLVNITNYIHTFKRIFKSDEVIKDSFVNVRLFEHPFGDSKKYLDVDTFREYSKDLEIEWSQKFPNFKVGYLIQFGEPNSILLGNDTILGNDIIYALDPHDVKNEIDQLDQLENEVAVLLPKKNILNDQLWHRKCYLFDINWIKASDVSELEASEEDIKQIDLLKKKYNVNSVEETLDEREKRLEEERKKLKEEEERIKKEEEEWKKREEERKKRKEERKKREEERLEKLRVERDLYEQGLRDIAQDISEEIINQEIGGDFNKLQKIMETTINHLKIMEEDIPFILEELRSFLKYESEIISDENWEELEKILLKLEEKERERLKKEEERREKELERQKKEMEERKQRIDIERRKIAETYRAEYKKQKEYLKETTEWADEVIEDGQNFPVRRPYDPKAQEKGTNLENIGNETYNLLSDIKDYLYELKNDDLVTATDLVDEWQNLEEEITIQIEVLENIERIQEIRDEIDIVRDEMNTKLQNIKTIRWKISDLYYKTRDVKGVTPTKVATPKDIIFYKKESIYLDEVILRDEEEIPFLFNSRDDWQKWVDWKYNTELGTTKSSNPIPMGLSANLYDTISKVIDLIGDLANIRHPIYLVWYYHNYDKDPKTTGRKGEDAFYMRKHYMIAINGYHLRSKGFQNFTKMNKVYHLIQLICHELSHDLVTGHNKFFLQRFEYLMYESRKNNIDIEIRKVLK